MNSNPIGSTIKSKMTHFIQYHNTDAMGPLQPPNKDFGIVTNKRSGVNAGDTVWLVMGEGRPRRYLLCETFVVETVALQKAGKFRYRVSGPDGKPFNPPLKIDDTAWFGELQKITGNFRYGLQPIKNQSTVEALQRVSGS